MKYCFLAESFHYFFILQKTEVREHDKKPSRGSRYINIPFTTQGTETLFEVWLPFTAMHAREEGGMLRQWECLVCTEVFG